LLRPLRAAADAGGPGPQLPAHPQGHAALIRLPHAAGRLRLAHRQLPQRGDSHLQELPDDLPVPPVAGHLPEVRLEPAAPLPAPAPPPPGLDQTPASSPTGAAGPGRAGPSATPAEPASAVPSPWSTPTPPGASRRSRRMARATFLPTSGWGRPTCCWPSRSSG